MIDMFRVTFQSLHPFRTGFMKTSFSTTTSTCPSWRKCSGSGGNANVANAFSSTNHPHMTTIIHHLQYRPITVFQFVKSNLKEVKVTSCRLRTYHTTGYKVSSTFYDKDYNIAQENKIRNYSSTKIRDSMGGKRPGLIVFDLDCTLWPLHVDTTVNPPFIQTDSKIVDQDGKLITYFPEVPQVLEYLKSEGYPIGVASRTTKPPGAEQLLTFFDWNKYISYKEIYPGSKVTHFARFAEQTKLPYEEMLFFDDEQRNIIDMKQQGVKCIFVDENGVTLQLVKDSIEQFINGKL